MFSAFSGMSLGDVLEIVILRKIYKSLLLDEFSCEMGELNCFILM